MFIEIPLSDLVLSKYNVRKRLTLEDDETSIENLASSIKATGLINPLTVQLNGNGKYEILAGQRRYNALKKLDVKSVTCKVIENMKSEQAELLSFVENVQRNKMSQEDKCYIFNKLYNLCKGNVSDVAKICGFCVQTIKDYIFINENLSSTLFEKLDGKGESKLSMEIAILLSKTIPKENQFKVFEMICPLGTTEMKRQAILKFIKKEDDDDELSEHNENNNEGEPKEPKEKKQPIPKQPWVYDENNNPVIIPKNLYPEIVQLIKNNI